MPGVPDPTVQVELGRELRCCGASHSSEADEGQRDERIEMNGRHWTPPHVSEP
jgi:hypothetical protein